MGNPKHKTAPVAPASEAGNENSNISREAVNERGLDLAKRLAETGGMYLTQAEGADLVSAGFATVNVDDVQGDTALVQLTAAGLALITPATAKAAKVVIEIDTDVKMPEAQKKRGGKRGSKYPFDKLEIGASFHVPKSKDMPNPVSALASSLTGARRRYESPVLDSEGKPVMETVTVKTYAVDAKGKRVKANGKFVVTGEKATQRAKVIQNRDFQVFEVGADDPKGEGARVFRTK